MIGSGKDTVAEILVKEHGFTRLSFSASLKDAVSSIFIWERSMLEGDTAESREWRELEDKWWTDRLDFGIPITPRWVLQNMGTEIMRDNFHPDIWILSLSKTIQQTEGNIVISDARFLNEIQLIKDMKDGLCVGVYRKLPKWLDRFYSKVDNATSADLGRSFLELDLTSTINRSVLPEYAKAVLQELSIELHQSEWEHLLFNKYDLVIDNTKSLKNLHKQATDLANL